MDGERGKTRSEGDEDGRSGRMERRNQEATVMDWSVSMKSERGLEDQREEAATCWPPSLILNETLLIRANPSAGPPGCVVGADTLITASGLTACHSICRSVHQPLDVKWFRLKGSLDKNVQ